MNPPVSQIALAFCVAFSLGVTQALAQESAVWGSVSGVIVASATHGSGEPSWVQGGFGKLQVGGDSTQASIDGVLAWRPKLTQRIGAVVSVSGDFGSQSRGGIDEAYLTLRADPDQTLRFSGRLGLFFPPISLEHDGSDWSSKYTVTPSAINSWVAEEVKTVGVEITARGSILNRPTGVTVAAFQGNDTAGALLAFRGWALHSRRAVLGGSFRVAPLSPMFQGGQGEKTHNIDEVDGRLGVYGRFEMALSDDLTVHVFAYDNRGDRTSIVAGQYAWRTRFGQVGARWTPNAQTEVVAQLMSGNAGMGGRIGKQYPADIGFAAAFGLISRDIGPGKLALRLEHFSVDDRSFKVIDNNAEHGWSTTASWSQPISTRMQVVAEGVLVQSDRPSRAWIGLSRGQSDLATRLALKSQF